MGLLYLALRQQRPRSILSFPSLILATNAASFATSARSLQAETCTSDRNTSSSSSVSPPPPTTSAEPGTGTSKAAAKRQRQRLRKAAAAQNATITSKDRPQDTRESPAKLNEKSSSRSKRKSSTPKAARRKATTSILDEMCTEARTLSWHAHRMARRLRGMVSNDPESTSSSDKDAKDAVAEAVLDPDASASQADNTPPSRSRRPTPCPPTLAASETQILLGKEATAAAQLAYRDENGKLRTSIQFSGPQVDQERKWSESITGSISASDIPVEVVEPLRKMEVATLAHGLDRVLFNPGVYWLRDPRSGIYNFDPRLRNVLDVDLFDYAALPPYVTSSQDPELAKLTKKHARKYCGSTSSMTALLSQCYFLISGWRDPDASGFSPVFAMMPQSFSAGAKLPASIKLKYNPEGDHYAIDADKEASGEPENSNYVLTSLGKSMEKMLTATPEEYEKYMRINSWQLSEEERTKPEAYHYAKTPKLMMRSQLDCQDDRLPRRTFDLKTRASVVIRNDRANYVEGSGYQIRRATGLIESFEREYFDMIRAAFLKYNFQARIGHMDGIFVAYHSTSTIFGFQYISVEEMNERLFGDQLMAEHAFKLSLGMLEMVLDAATSLFPSQSLKITVEARERADAPMSLFVEPATPPSEGGGRKIAQLDVTIDRFLNGGLVRGPVDFSALPGRLVDPWKDDEIERRQRESLPPVSWDIDYRLDPRSDLSEDEIARNLEAIRSRQRSLSSLLLPNVDALNERERYRETQLATNPDALKRFLEERATGVAAGMPLAPGQQAAAEPAEEAKKSEADTKWGRIRDARTLRLRDLARLGAQDAQDLTKTDKLEMYQPRS